VFLARPRGWRNQVWQTDHVQAPVLVDVEGTACTAVDHVVHRLRDERDHRGGGDAWVSVAGVGAGCSALRGAAWDPFGPFGGLPDKVRLDRGKDFLFAMVTAVFDVLDVTVEDLPAYTPHCCCCLCYRPRGTERQ
jgi:putative transposase